MSMIRYPGKGRPMFGGAGMISARNPKPIPSISGNLAADLTVAGLSAATFTRSTTATFTDYEGVLRTAAINEPRFEGGRRVENKCVRSDPSLVAHAAYQSNISIQSGGIVNRGCNNAVVFVDDALDRVFYAPATLEINSVYLFSAIVKMNDGSAPVIETGNSNPNADFRALIDATSASTINAPVPLSNNEYLVSWYLNVGPSIGSHSGGIIKYSAQSPKGFIVSGFQIEDITGSAYTLPSEYIPTSGAAVSKWFTTRLDGSPIYPAPRLLMEGQSTNYFLQSGTPANHTSPSCPTGTYTLWLNGSGSVAVAAGTAVGSKWGTATESAPVTVTITTAGTVVFTVSGTVTRAQFEPLPVKSSYIPTTTAAVTRTSDACSWPLSSELQSMLAADGTIVLDWTPGFIPPESQIGIVSCAAAVDSLLSVAAGGSVTRATDGATPITGGATLVTQTQRKLMLRWSAASGKYRLSSVVGGVITHGTEGNFDGAFTLGSNLLFHYSNAYPAKYSALKLFKRYLTDSELMRLQ